jgi:hypothetical protein
MYINVELKCIPGDKCIVLNYRRKPSDWENGKCSGVKVKIRNDGSYHVFYEVTLDRTSKNKSRLYPDGGCPLFVTVGDDGIRKTI